MLQVGATGKEEEEESTRSSSPISMKSLTEKCGKLFFRLITFLAVDFLQFTLNVKYFLWFLTKSLRDVFDLSQTATEN
jgi:hypothetical protein